MKKIICLLVGVTLMSGCAARALRKKFIEDAGAIVRTAIESNEPCDITCEKIKKLVKDFKDKLK